MSELANFGKIICQYHGYGKLHIDVENHRPCEFEVIQNAEGTLYAVCDMQEIDVTTLNLERALQLTGIVENEKKLVLKSLIRKDKNIGFGKQGSFL